LHLVLSDGDLSAADAHHELPAVTGSYCSMPSRWSLVGLPPSASCQFSAVAW
jgi:hypothetical protein